ETKQDIITWAWLHQEKNQDKLQVQVGMQPVNMRTSMEDRKDIKGPKRGFFPKRLTRVDIRTTYGETMSEPYLKQLPQSLSAISILTRGKSSSSNKDSSREGCLSQVCTSLSGAFSLVLPSSNPTSSNTTLLQQYTYHLLPLKNHMISQQASDLSNPFRQMTLFRSTAELYHDFIALPYVQLCKLSPCVTSSLNPVPPRLLTCRLLNRFRIFYHLTQPSNVHPLRRTFSLTHTLTHAHTSAHLVAYSPQQDGLRAWDPAASEPGSPQQPEEQHGSSVHFAAFLSSGTVQYYSVDQHGQKPEDLYNPDSNPRLICTGATTLSHLLVSSTLSRHHAACTRFKLFLSLEVLQRMVGTEGKSLQYILSICSAGNRFTVCQGPSELKQGNWNKRQALRSVPTDLGTAGALLGPVLEMTAIPEGTTYTEADEFFSKMATSGTKIQ
ncbi:hypothetical protein U0070_020236, partial [Myodes glareolus]